MYPVTITFKRVFDVIRRPAPYERKYEKYTVFSFEADGVVHYGVEIYGWPEIEDGMTVTALLEKNGDWKSMVGWVDHKKCIAVCERYLAALPIAVAGAVAFVLLPWEGAWSSIIVRALMAVVVGAGLYQFQRGWRANRELSNILNAIHAKRQNV